MFHKIGILVTTEVRELFYLFVLIYYKFLFTKEMINISISSNNNSGQDWKNLI